MWPNYQVFNAQLMPNYLAQLMPNYQVSNAQVMPNYQVSLQVTSRVKLIIQEWITICQNKSGEHHEQHVVRFANQIQQCNEETKSHLFKMYAEYIADTNFNNYMQNKVLKCTMYGTMYRQNMV